MAKLTTRVGPFNTSEIPINPSTEDTLLDIKTLLEGGIAIDASDIQIGAVELKDGNTDTRADIELDGAKNALFVQSESLATSANQQTDALTDTQLRASAVPVSVASLPLPSGAATSANQTTIIGHVDGIEGLLTTIDADTSTIAGAVSGSEMQVDIVSMPAVDTELTTADLDTGAGTDTRAVVGLVGSASGGGQLIPGSATEGLLVNLGTNNDVTVSGTVTAELSAVDNAVLDDIALDTEAIKTAVEILDNAIAGTEMQVDIVSAPTLTVQATNLDIRDLTSVSDSVSVHGDVGIIDQLDLTNSNPAVVAVVDANGDQITSFGGGTQYAEDAALGATPTGTLGIARRDDALATLTPIEDDAVSLRTNERGALWVANDNTVDTKVTLDGESVVVTATDLDIRNLTNTDVVTAELSAVDNAVLDSIDVNLTTIIGHVDGLEALLTTIDADTGSIATSNSAIQTAVQIMDDWDNAASDGASVSGDVAHDAVDAGEPVKVGMKAIAHGANPTAVAANDRTNWYANRAGVPWVIGGHPNVVTLRANYTSAQTNAAIISVAPGTIIVVTRCSVLADNANTVDVQARIGFATATTPTTTGVVLSHPGIPAGLGVVEGNGSGIIGIGADGADLRITSEVPTGGSIDVVVNYYTIEG